MSTKDSSSVVVSVVSAVALTAEEKKQVSALVAKKVTDQDLTYTYIVDGGVLGGLKIEVGDLVLDTTIAAQLKKLKTGLEN